MKRKLSILMVFAMITIAIFILSGCGRGIGIIENGNAGQQDGSAAQVSGTEGVQHTPMGDIFTISTPFGNLSRLQDSAEAFEQSLAEQGIHVQIDFIYYMQDEWQSHHDLLLSKFAAGVGPDIFLRDNYMLYPFIENGFLADIYTVIDQSSHFSRNDFFTNVLEGQEVNGRLYMLPMNFGFDYIGINANVPPAFIRRFEDFDRASPTDIAALYLDLINQYPEWADFAFIHGFNPNQAFAPELSHVVDFAARTVDLSATASLLESIRPAFEGNQRFETAPFFNWQSPIEDLTVMQERYVFSRISGVAGIYGLFEFREPFFVNYVPLADEGGRLVNRAWGTEFAVSHTANPDLVMGFIGQHISDIMAEDFRFGLDIPILREYFQQGLESGFRHMLTQMALPPIVDSEGVAITQAISRMEAYSTWPSTTLIANFLMPPWAALGALPEFFESDMPAYEVISQMEAAIAAWFNEERPEIEPFVYIPAVELPDLPVRTLTIRTDNRHTGVILQAADAMNAAWQERGEPYIFQVEVEDHSWVDWEGMEGRAVRLQTELMSGQGPDMFILDGQDMHAFSASGFLQNIYTLMDADPSTSRDEFFTQALEAFEINNGLYVFPVSFGFEYIAINASLPQEFVNRFAQKSTISLSEMMEFYLDLMEAHGEEFGHLTFDTGTGITWSGSVLQTIMGGFVDFNTRTSNLLDPRFVEALELIDVVYANWDVQNTWGTTIGTADFLRDRAQEYVFFAITNGLNNFDAFFTEETPIFTHHIPLVDDYGRFMLTTPGAHGQVWSGICITAVGDGALAWELTRHMIYAYTNPVGRAAVEPVFGSSNTWGNHSFATPIMRSLFRDHAMQTFENTFDNWSAHGLQTFVGLDDDANRMQQFEAAINRIAAYNEQPMGMLSPNIPTGIFDDHFEQFRLGLINAETAAQRIHNAVSLWLIE